MKKQKRILMLLFAILIAGVSFGQINVFTFGQNDPSIIKMTSRHIASDNRDLATVLRLFNADFTKSEFTGENLQSKYFTLICKNIWNGEITEIDTIISAKYFKSIGRQLIRTDTLSLDILGGKAGDKRKIDFNFSGAGLWWRTYKAVDSDLYSLRPALLRMQINIELNKFTPIFIYMLPTPQGQYCAVERNGGDIETWGKEFSIEHYMIFEIMFEE